jgi:hypothetical protein
MAMITAEEIASLARRAEADGDKPLTLILYALAGALHAGDPAVADLALFVDPFAEILAEYSNAVLRRQAERN